MRAQLRARADKIADTARDACNDWAERGEARVERILWPVFTGGFIAAARLWVAEGVVGEEGLDAVVDRVGLVGDLCRAG